MIDKEAEKEEKEKRESKHLLRVLYVWPVSLPLVSFCCKIPVAFHTIYDVWYEVFILRDRWVNWNARRSTTRRSLYHHIRNSIRDRDRDRNNIMNNIRKKDRNRRRSNGIIIRWRKRRHNFFKNWGNGDFLGTMTGSSLNHDCVEIGNNGLEATMPP